MCCGEGRKVVTQEFSNRQTGNPPSSPVPFAPVPDHPQSAEWSSIRLRYLQKSPIRVGGPVSGRIYDFSGERPVLPVESRDAESLLRTGFFTRAD